jgi:hypothetical protein
MFIYSRNKTAEKKWATDTITSVQMDLGTFMERNLCTTKGEIKEEGMEIEPSPREKTYKTQNKLFC